MEQKFLGQFFSNVLYKPNDIDNIGLEFTVIDNLISPLKKEKPTFYLNRIAKHYLNLYALNPKHDNKNSTKQNCIFVYVSIITSGTRILEGRVSNLHQINQQLKLFSGKTLHLNTIMLVSYLDSEFQSKKIFQTRIKTKKLSTKEHDYCLNSLKTCDNCTFFSLLENFAQAVNGDFRHLFRFPVCYINNVITSLGLKKPKKIAP